MQFCDLHFMVHTENLMASFWEFSIINIDSNYCHSILENSLLWNTRSKRHGYITWISEIHAIKGKHTNLQFLKLAKLHLAYRQQIACFSLCHSENGTSVNWSQNEFTFVAHVFTLAEFQFWIKFVFNYHHHHHLVSLAIFFCLLSLSTNGIPLACPKQKSEANITGSQMESNNWTLSTVQLPANEMHFN